MPREITIRPVLNGFVCNVGCQVVVFTDTKSLGRAVEEYFDHPEETEKRYIEKAINRMEACPQPAQANRISEASEPCPPPQMQGRLRDPR